MVKVPPDVYFMQQGIIPEFSNPVGVIRWGVEWGKHQREWDNSVRLVSGAKQHINN